jgi:hypothetical protein
MSDDALNLSRTTVPPAGRRRLRHRKTAIVVLAAVTALGVGAVLPLWQPWRSYPGAPAVEHFPEGSLDGYLPADACGVLTVNLRLLLAPPAARRNLRKPLQQLLRHGERVHPWMSLVGADPWTDLDRIRVVFCGGGQPLWVARGRFDPARFQTGPGKLGAKVEAGFRVYESHGPQPGRLTTLALAGDTLVASDDRGRLLAALGYAAGLRKAAPVDPTLKKLVRAVDRDQGLWLAVSFDKLGHVSRLPSLGVDLMVRPILSYARTARGGLRFGADVRADFLARARDGAAARDLETGLRSVCETAAGVSLLPGIEPDLVPLFRLLATGQVTRDGTAVRLQCRLAPDQLGG